MDPATPAQGEFFRVHIGPSAIMFEGRIAWVKSAADPQTSIFDRKASVFRHLSLTDAKDQAAVYPATTAAAIISVLRTTYCRAGVEPATFDEWILSEAGPGT